MKAEMAQCVGECLWLLVVKILKKAVVLVDMLCTWWSPSLSEGENEDEQAVSWTLVARPNNGRRWPTLLQTETASHSNHHDRYFYPRRQVNNFNFPDEAFSPNLIFAPMIKILLSFLQIRSSAASTSPFQLHPVIFVAAVICSITYYLSFAAKFMFLGFASLFEVVMSASGFLAIASLTPLVLQLPSWSIFFILLFLGGFLKLLEKLHGIYGNIHHPQP